MRIIFVMAIFILSCGCQTSSVDFGYPKLSKGGSVRGPTSDCHVLPIKWDAEAKDWRPDYRRIRQAQRNCAEKPTYSVPIEP